MANKGWIGVDLDGTLAFYDGWRGENHVGAPIAPMVNRVKMWLSEGKTVKIFTARVSGLNPTESEYHIVMDAINDWALEHIGQELEVTCSKDYYMVELWDDRCVQVETNTGRAITDG